MVGLQNYADRSGITQAIPILREVADALVAQVGRDAHVYAPRKQRGRRQLVSTGWPERLRNYEWQPKKGFDGVGEASRLMAEFEPLARRIDAGEVLDEEEHQRLCDLVKRTFAWGGVQRGASKVSPTPHEIEAVIRSAHRWIDEGAFMDAGWTKVAAFSTAWVEAQGRTPQIIFDSRVAIGLIRNVEKLALNEDAILPSSLLPFFQTHLRSVPGRNANKLAALRLTWKSGYRQWDAQFFGSLLVSLMRDALNASLDRYGRMPHAASDGPWTMRGVEMVMFMEGY